MQPQRSEKIRRLRLDVADERARKIAEMRAARMSTRLRCLVRMASPGVDTPAAMRQ